MAYQYGQSPVHKFPTPLDGTPLDQVSWARLVDTLGVGTPVVCASQAEQDAYLAAVRAANLGPSSRQIIRVCRTDLGSLVMRNDGTGWARDWGGDKTWWVASEASAVDNGGTTRSLGAFAVNLPCAAQIAVAADVIAYPPTNGIWAFVLWLRDANGTDLSPKRRYANITTSNTTHYNAILQAIVKMPAGSGQVQLWSTVEPASGPIRWANVAMSGHYA